jgi:hypothetical protein
MRLLAIAALTAGLSLAAASGAYAVPINATSIVKAGSAISPLTTVQYYRHRYYRHRYYRPYYYGYRPYYYRPYYYGYGPYYRPYYYRPYYYGRPFWW